MGRPLAAVSPVSSPASSSSTSSSQISTKRARVAVAVAEKPLMNLGKVHEWFEKIEPPTAPPARSPLHPQALGEALGGAFHSPQSIGPTLPACHAGHRVAPHVYVCGPTPVTPPNSHSRPVCPGPSPRVVQTQRRPSHRDPIMFRNCTSTRPDTPPPPSSAGLRTPSPSPSSPSPSPPAPLVGLGERSFWDFAQEELFLPGLQEGFRPISPSYSPTPTTPTPSESDEPLVTSSNHFDEGIEVVAEGWGGSPQPLGVLGEEERGAIDEMLVEAIYRPHPVNGEQYRPEFDPTLPEGEELDRAIRELLRR